MRALILILSTVTACAPAVDCERLDGRCVSDEFLSCVVDALDIAPVIHGSPITAMQVDEDDSDALVYCVDEVSGGCNPTDHTIVIVDERATGHELVHMIDRRRGGDGDYDHVRGDYERGDRATDSCLDE